MHLAIAPVGSLFSDVPLPAVAVDEPVLLVGAAVAAAAGAGEDAVAAAAVPGDAAVPVAAVDPVELLFTPPWCEHAPFPAFDDEPSLHVTVAVVAVACALTAIGATRQAAATAAVMSDRGRMHTSTLGLFGTAEPTTSVRVPGGDCKCSRLASSGV